MRILYCKSNLCTGIFCESARSWNHALVFKIIATSFSINAICISILRLILLYSVKKSNLYLFIFQTEGFKQFFGYWVLIHAAYNIGAVGEENIWMETLTHSVVIRVCECYSQIYQMLTAVLHWHIAEIWPFIPRFIYCTRTERIPNNLTNFYCSLFGVFLKLIIIFKKHLKTLQESAGCFLYRRNCDRARALVCHNSVLQICWRVRAQ